MLSNAYVVWEDTPLLAITKYFSEQAKAWAPINTSTNTGFSQNPQIAVSGNNVYVTWSDDHSFWQR